MTQTEETIAKFQTRLRQMLLLFQQLQQQNAALSARVSTLESELAQRQAALEQGQRDYQSLKMAKMMEITDGDLNGAKERLAQLIREVNKCIVLLSEKEQ